ncbi:2OG-Fe(II) oxygenase family protein [Klebsiella pneumoniae]|uniref:2OG-Fe(II) oxygenase family protein n=1 Tax=Klebsiella pneumoniae TaxID=573 RepID=UPI001F24D8EB|nr:2OG-Fe(II) oxygenase family protein [Klebsiella pneumoniae]
MSQPAIDLTSELLRGMRLSGVNYRRIETARPFGVGFSAVAGKAQFHFISRGPVLLRMASGEQFTLESGDALFIPNGDGHALLSDPQATVVNVAQLPSETVCSTVSCINAGDQPDCPERAVIFSGCMDFELGGMQPLVKAMPEVMRVSSLLGEKPNEHIKLIRYPGQQETQSSQGVGAHKDSGFLSFLLQDEQKGLQVEVAPGEWIDAVPLAGSFVVNIGELLELATNGYLRATVHRVVSPPAQQQRLSIAFFLGAQLDAVVPVYTLPPELAREARGPDSDPHNPLLRDVGWNYLKGRLRSHPDVAERYYQDVFRERAEQLIV